MSTEQPVAKPRRLEAKPFLLADKIFFGLANAAAYSAIVIILLVLVFLLGRAWPAFAEQGVLAFVTGAGWDNSTDPILMRIGPMLYGTLLIAALAVAYAVPLAISIAYFIEFLAPKSLSKIATLLIDLLAAIPSVVVGLWGLIGCSWFVGLDCVLSGRSWLGGNAERWLELDPNFRPRRG
ncbi:MAG: phosphate transporter permease subunit PstC [Actinomycetota bacterium]